VKYARSVATVRFKLRRVITSREFEEKVLQVAACAPRARSRRLS